MSSSGGEMRRDDVSDQPAQPEVGVFDRDDLQPDELARMLLYGLLSSASIGMIVFDVHATLRYWNAAAYTLLGRSPEELVERSAYDSQWNAVHEDGTRISKAENPILRVVKTGRPLHGMVVGIHNPLKHQRTWLLADIVPWCALDGQIELIIATFSDITSRKHAEQRQEVLARVGGLISSSLDYTTTLQNVAQMVIPVLADWCTFLALESDQTLRRVAFASGFVDETGAGARLPSHIALSNLNPQTGQIVATGAIELIPEVDDDYLEAISLDPEHAQTLRELGTHSLIRIPLVARRQTLGLLIVAYGRSGRLYTQDDVLLMEDLASSAALAVDNALLFGAVQRRLAELSTIQQVAQVINSTAPLDTMFEQIVETISQAFGYRMISVYLREGEQLCLQAALGYAEVIATIPVSQGMSGRVARSGQAEFMHDASTDPSFISAAPGTCQAIIVPLKTNSGAVIGTLAVEATTPILTDDDLTILILLADQIGVALTNAQLFGALRDSERRYRALIDQAADAILLTDAAWRITDANIQATALLGRARQEILGLELPALREPAPDAPAWPPPRASAFQIQRGDGTLCPVEASVSNLLDRGHINHIVILRDISARIQAEELQRTAERRLLEAQRLESLGVLAGGIAHDFNNLLMTIAGSAALATHELPAEAATHAHLAQIEAAAKRAADLTQQMIAYAGKARVILRPTSLTHMAEELSPLLRTMVGGRAISIEERLEPDLPLVMADEPQLRQVLLHLFTNAIEAIGSERGTITITTARHPADDLAVLIAVGDSGPGIDHGLHQRIFEPFFSTKFPGRGLGLAAVQGILRSHTSTVHVESSPGQGARFIIRMPVAQAPAPQQKPPEPRPGELLPAQLAILVVDDEPSVRSTVIRMLRQIGLSAEAAEDGPAALQSLAERPGTIGAVLLDLTMPHMSGVEVFGILQESHPRLPVVLMSGYTAEEVNSQFEGHGPAYFLQKPFSLASLREALADALAASKLRV